MAQKLTERQQQVKDLMEAGKKPTEIGEALGISTNAVYQQIRRMREDGGKSGRKSAARAAARRTATHREIARQGSLTHEAVGRTTANTATVVAATPLQAIRRRRSEIEAEIKEAAAALLAANKAVAEAKLAHEKVEAKHKDERLRLSKAEMALSTSGRPKASAPKASAKAATNGGEAKVPETATA